MLKVLKETADYFKDIEKLGNSDKDEAFTCSRKLVARLYDQRKHFQTSHHDMNKLRVKVATGRDVSLVRLPPSEAALKQHSLRASLQTQIWTASHVAIPHIPSPLEYGWRKGKDSLQPVYFEGPMSSDFLQDLVYSCKCKSTCKKSCVCFEQNFTCTDLCSCQGSELCKNAQTHILREDTSQVTDQ